MENLERYKHLNKFLKEKFGERTLKNRNKKYEPISLDYYLESLAYILTHISPDIIIHRLSGDAPKNLLIAPDWNLHKKWVINGIDKLLKERNLYQGIFL